MLALPSGKLRGVFCGTDLGLANIAAPICALQNQDWRGVGGRFFAACACVPLDCFHRSHCSKALHWLAGPLWWWQLRAGGSSALQLQQPTTTTEARSCFLLFLTRVRVSEKCLFPPLPVLVPHIAAPP